MMMKNLLVAAFACLCFGCNDNAAKVQAQQSDDDSTKTANNETPDPGKPTLDTVRYNQLLNYMANGDSSGRWPVKSAYPLPGAILPFKRVVAYYGNLYSNRMGALGKWPKKEMIPKLMDEVKKWTEADSSIPAVPALHYIAVTAQGSAGKDGKWRYRMPHHQIDTILNWAKEINGIVFIDVQIGLSDLQSEIPLFEKYLSMPNVHLGIDPEFAMKAKGNKKPGSVIGSLDAADINYVSDYLAGLVRKHNLPPKMLMVHRFTKGMVTNYKNIKLHPELQIIMDMDGWGPPDLKMGTYKHWIESEPVQFTGFKLFYVNDTEKSGRKEMMSRQQILNLKPKPVYIQYQ
ncbi:MAG TPA: hypothetical protein VFQ73_06360 [Flavisolibacter sp.]|nr:hypothetical protein [Flavisolibacter sp.]